LKSVPSGRLAGAVVVFGDLAVADVVEGTVLVERVGIGERTCGGGCWMPGNRMPNGLSESCACATGINPDSTQRAVAESSTARKHFMRVGLAGNTLSILQMQDHPKPKQCCDT
jgi:hypothetical protein